MAQMAPQSGNECLSGARKQDSDESEILNQILTTNK